MVDFIWDTPALRQAESLFGAVADALGEIFFTSLPDGSCAYASPRFATYTGMSADGAKGSGWVQAVHPDDLARVQAHWQDVLRSGGLFEAEYRLREASGAYRWFLVRKVPLHDAEGRVVKWLGTWTDVNQLKRDRAARAWLVAIEASSADAIVGTDLDGTIQTWNAAAERLYGYAASEIVGRPLTLLVP
jgi:PAS domain S-box-containing protein